MPVSECVGGIVPNKIVLPPVLLVLTDVLGVKDGVRQLRRLLDDVVVAGEPAISRYGKLSHLLLLDVNVFSCGLWGTNVVLVGPRDEETHGESVVAVGTGARGDLVDNRGGHVYFLGGIVLSGKVSEKATKGDRTGGTNAVALNVGRCPQQRVVLTNLNVTVHLVSWSWRLVAVVSAKDKSQKKNNQRQNAVFISQYRSQQSFGSPQEPFQTPSTLPTHKEHNYLTCLVVKEGQSKSLQKAGASQGFSALTPARSDIAAINFIF